MIRDPLADHLLTPQHAALLVIDEQPSRSSPWIGRGAEEQRVDGEAGEDLGAADRAFHGQRFVRPKQADRPELADLLEESPSIDRTTLNAWEDADVLAAVRAAGRRKLVLCALWIEMCIACKCFFSERIQQNFSSSL
jgi:isochorismate hydrolase